MLKAMKILVLIFGLIFTNIIVEPVLSFLAADEEANARLTQTGQQNRIVLLRPKVEYTSENFEDPFRLLPETKIKTEDSLEVKEELTPPELIVSGLVWGSDSPLAIINGQVCKVGDMIENARIESIDKNGVVVEFDWRKFTLPVNNLSVVEKNKINQNEISNQQSIPARYPIRRPNDAI